MLKKGSLVWGIEPPIHGEGWPGHEVLGIICTYTKEVIWVEYPDGVMCLFNIMSIQSADLDSLVLGE